MKNCYAYLNSGMNSNSVEEDERNTALINHENVRMRHSLRRKTMRNKYARRVKLYTNLWNGFSPERVPAYAHALKTCSIPCKGWDNDEGETAFRIRKNEKAVKRRMNNIHEEFLATSKLEEVFPGEELVEYERFLQQIGSFSWDGPMEF